MRILVTGASGFLGRNVIARLLERGHDVRAIIRPTSTLPELERRIEIFHGDLRVHDNLSSAFEGIDAVLHLAAATSGNEDAQFQFKCCSLLSDSFRRDGKSTPGTLGPCVVAWLCICRLGSSKILNGRKYPVVGKSVRDGGLHNCQPNVGRNDLCTDMRSDHSWNLTIARFDFIWVLNAAEIAGMGRHAGRIYLMFGPFTRLPLCHVSNCADCLISMIENSDRGHAFNVVRHG